MSTDDYDLCVECEPLSASKHKHPSSHNSTHNMLVFCTHIPQVSQQRAGWSARNFLSTLLPVGATPEESLTTRNDESNRLSDEPALCTENPVSNEDVYTCAECDVKLMNIFYACMDCQVRFLSLRRSMKLYTSHSK
jgi:hypothetical protein